MHVDLHSHTTVSDGVLTPEELVDHAARKGLRFLAITDHDSTDGLERAVARSGRYPSLTVIPGVELSADVKGSEVHILGYLDTFEDSGFQEEMKKFRDGRVGRAREMVEKLAKLGVEVDWERVKEIAGDGAVGRPHVAQALEERGHVGSVQEAFDLYLGNGRPAYVGREKLKPGDAIRLIQSVGGKAVLAHPSFTRNVESLLPSMKAEGLAGMEVYYARYTPEMISRMKRLADKHELIPCGGSDYHGPGLGPDIDLGDVDVPESSVHRLLGIGESKGG